MTETQTLRTQRGHQKARLTRLEAFFTTFDPQINGLHDITTRISTLSSIRDDFQTISNRLLSTDEEANANANVEEAVNFEERALILESRMLQLLAVYEDKKPDIPPKTEESGSFEKVLEMHSKLLEKMNISQGGGVSHNLPKIAGKLPALQFKTFDGKPEEYLPFIQQFDSVIQGHNLSEAAKYWYLTQNMKKEPLNLVSNLEQQADSYTAGRALLNKRYNQKRLLINNHVRALFNVPAMAEDTSQALRALVTSTNKELGYLASQDAPVDQWAILLVSMVSAKLHPTSRGKVEEKLPVNEIPDWDLFIKTLDERCEVLEAMEQAKQNRFFSQSSSKVEHQSKSKVKEKAFAYTSTSTDVVDLTASPDRSKRASSPRGKTPKKGEKSTPSGKKGTQSKISCAFCQQNHFTSRCYKYLDLTPTARMAKVKSLTLCENCLRTGHEAASCNSTNSCFKCKQRHNTTLHEAFGKASSAENQSENMLAIESATFAGHIDSSVHVMLATASIRVKDSKGKLLVCRTLLDSCAQSNFITQEFVNAVKMPTQRISISVRGIGGAAACATRCVELEICSRLTNFTKKLKFVILPNITGDLPNEKIDLSEEQVPSDIELADPNFHVPGKIDMLIGAELFYEILGSSRKSIASNLPVLYQTQFGYIAAGKFSNDAYEQRFSELACMTTYESLDQQVKQFWQLEEIESSPRKFTAEEQACEDLFIQTTTRDEDGKFIVRLPKRQPETVLGGSFSKALACFRSLERRFAADPSLAEMYRAFMKEYRDLGHMQLAIGNSNDRQAMYYIPHLPVIRPDAETTVLRTVFNASAKTTSGVSLNDILRVGPIIQDGLWAILIRFRLHQFVFIADIQKMYRKVRIHQDDYDLQRILWRDDPSEPIRAYQLTTVTYGTAPASYLATRCLKQLAEDNARRYPAAIQAMSDFYMDDIMTGSSSVDELLETQSQIVRLLDSGGFQLHKWASNNPRIIEAVNSAEGNIVRVIKSEDSIKTLGLRWNTHRDFFHFSVQLNDIAVTTKRGILSEITRLFDPLGLVGPVIVNGKLLIRKLWALKLDWDDKLPADLEKCWLDYRTALNELNKCRIPRWLHSAIPNEFEIHGFCDASEAAYGAAVYLRAIDSNGVVYSNLICSRSRIAPIKQTTMPRLELCGALLLAQLIDKILDAVKPFVPRNVHLWSDSTIVLSWIMTDVAKLKQFVGNRVEIIQQLTNGHFWHHVDGKSNPADLISRGVACADLIGANMWWNGPKWLCEPIKYEQPFNIDSSSECCKELRPVTNLVSMVFNCDITRHYSSATQTIRVVAVCRRYLANLNVKRLIRKGLSDDSGLKFLDNQPLSSSELEDAHTVCIKLVQQECFKHELKDLSNGETVNKSKSKLSALIPFIDEKGLIRVRGRLQKSHLTKDEIHSIILPSSHPFVLSLVRREHIKHFHAGPTLLQSLLRRRYWILRCRNLIRRVTQSCITCFKARPQPIVQRMAPLPSYRVQQFRPFVNTGIDFAGPFSIKSSKLRNAPILKGYIAIFVCMSTKALHIELVSDLSSASFLGALKRFMARRGKCAHIYSDNGRNFVGANREIVEFFEWLAQDETQNKIASDLRKDNICWHFNPPYAPHRGGLWEAGVKSAKYHLRRTVGTSILTAEEFNTFICEIEAILNSRPLTPVSSDPSDLKAITPGDFLIGHDMSASVDPGLISIPLTKHARWQLLTELKQSFWDRWHSEYLHNLQQVTNKWRGDPVEIEVGDLVIVQVDNHPVAQWPLGRVTYKHPSSDGIVRTVDVRLQAKTVTRAIQKLCLLPKNDEPVSFMAPGVETSKASPSSS